MSKTLLALLMTLSCLSACGGDDDGANTVATPAAPAPQAPVADAVIRCAPAVSPK
ncbi:hypothetical protein [Cupriavidus sp. WS]|uniref:hypothetical protein n=1 Tax=Cupriavidus sp. WS TaxID=1312922 RepID=UPI0003A454E1|nr:hypothetical protein [Cupriavidus sp. WS]